MRISDWINICLCILSFVLATISVVTVVITLKQNHKMIQNSTRPYVVAMAQIANFQSPTFYLVLKNYGASGATIKQMDSSIDLSEVTYREKFTPFNNIEGSFLAPGQMIMSSLDTNKFKEKNIREFTIHLKYTDGIKEYEENCPINYKAYIENVCTRASTDGKELRTISYTLQDLVEKTF